VDSCGVESMLQYSESITLDVKQPDTFPGSPNRRTSPDLAKRSISSAVGKDTHSAESWDLICLKLSSIGIT
jgi:hypothetical protein